MMNDPTLQRKLFQRKEARNKLREIGGIMASSPELMQTVQKFSAGSGPMGVRANQPTLGQLFGGPIVNRPSVFPQLPQLPQYPGQGASVSRQVPASTPTVAGSPAVRASRPADGKDPISQGLQGLYRDYIRDPINAIRDYIGAQYVDSDPNVSRRQYKLTAGQQADLQARLEAQGYDLSGDQRFSPQPSTIPDGEAAVSGAMAQDILGDAQLTPKGDDEFLPQMLGELSPAPDASGRREEEGMGEGLVEGFQQKPEDEAITGGANVSKDGTVKPAPPAIDESSITTDLQKSTAKVNEKRNELVSFLQGGASERDKNDAVLEMFGYKSPEEEIKNLKERAKINADMYREIAGVDPEDDKKIDGYNLAFMGFMIAAGDSPNALQNIANGMAKGTKNMMDTAKSRQARDQKFKIAGLDKAIADDKERKQVLIDSINKAEDRRFQVLRDELKNETTLQNTLLQLSSQELMLNKKLSVQKEIASDNRQSDEARATANNQIKLLTTQIVAMPELSALAIANVGSENLAEDPSLFGPALQQVLEDPNQLATAATIAGFGAKERPDLPPRDPFRFYQDLITKPQFREERIGEASENLKAAGIEKPTQSQLNAEIDAIARRISGYGVSQQSSEEPTTVFDQQPSAAVLQQLYQQGVRQVTIGGQVYPLQSQ